MCAEFEENVSSFREIKKTKLSQIKSIVPSYQQPAYLDLVEIVEVDEIAVTEEKTEACEQWGPRGVKKPAQTNETHQKPSILKLVTTKKASKSAPIKSTNLPVKQIPIELFVFDIAISHEHTNEMLSGNWLSDSVSFAVISFLVSKKIIFFIQTYFPKGFGCIFTLHL
jgi:hypothetical protein